METNNDRSREIRDGLGASLTVRRETLDHLADATAEYEAAGERFAASFDTAVKAGWTEAELAKFGIKRAGMTAPRKRKSRKTIQHEPQPQSEAFAEATN